MAALTRTVLRGLLLPDPRIDGDAYDATRSTVTQAGPQPGQAVAGNDTSAVLTATGTQSAGGSLQFHATAGGMPGLNAARTVWRNTGDARYRGWEVPQTISGFGFPAYTTTGGLYVDPSILRLASDGVLVAFEQTTTGQVLLRRRAATATTWTSEVVYTHPAGVYASGARPCMVQLPSGRVLLFHCVETTGYVNVGMRYSDDDGDTWTTGQLYCLVSPISTATAAVRRLRAAYHGGQIVLFVDIRDTSTTYYRRLAQYASADLGATFQLVTQLDGTTEANHAAFPDVVATSTGFVLSYVRYVTSGSGNRVRPYSRRLGSAYAIFTAASEVSMQDITNPMAWGTYAGGDITAGDMAACADDVGRIYAFGRDLSAAGYEDGAVRYSDDDGATWSGTGSSSHQTTKAMWWRGTDTSTAPRAYAATWQRGRALLATQHDSSGTTADASISLIALGGYAAHNLPALLGPITHDTMVAWEATYLPFDLPEATGTNWTAAPTGTPTISLGADGLTTAGGAGDVASWYATPTSTLAQGLIAEVWVAAITGIASLEVRVGRAGPDSYRARVEVTPTSIVLIDAEAGTTLVTITTTAGATGVWVRLAVGNDAVSGNNGRCAAYYAADARGDVEDRNFLEIGTSTTLTKGTDTTNQITVRAATTGVAFDADWHSIAYTNGSYAGIEGYAGCASPGGFLGRDLTARDAYVSDGLSIRGDDGPAYRNDTWTVAATYRYPIEAVNYDVQPSPRRTWRSTSDAADAVIAWTVNATVATVSPAPNLARVVYLGGINFRTARLEGLPVTGVWATIATIDAATGCTGLGFARADTMITPTYISTFPASSGITRMLTANELVGARFCSGSNVRRITWSSPGYWPGPLFTSGAAARFTVTSGSGISASAKNGEIWWPNVAMVINDTTGTQYSAYRIVIPAQTTAEGYFEVGVAMIGYLHTFGQQYSANRSQDIAASYEVTEGRGGTRRVQTTGPARRAVEVAWDEGVDASDLATAAGDDYVEGYTGGGALGSPADVVPSMLGVLNQLGGAATPCVYLPRVPVVSGGTTTTTINAPPLLLYGRIMTETLRMDTIQGDEYERPGEVYRLARVRIEEEL